MRCSRGLRRSASTSAASASSKLLNFRTTFSTPSILPPGANHEQTDKRISAASVRADHPASRRLHPPRPDLDRSLEISIQFAAAIAQSAQTWGQNDDITENALYGICVVFGIFLLLAWRLVQGDRDLFWLGCYLISTGV